MAEIPQLIDYVSDSLRAEVSDNFPLPLRTPLEHSLHTEKRWGENSPYYGDISHLPKKPGFSESVLEHTCGMLSIHNKLQEDTGLPGEINFRTGAYQIGFHDSGEAITHDAPSFGPARYLPYWVKSKRLEPLAAKKFIIARIPDLGVRGEITHFYDRYIEQNPNDKESLYVRLLDKVQATRVGINNVFDYQAVGWANPPDKLVEHISCSLDKLADATLKLVRILSTENRLAVINFIAAEIDGYQRIGFGELARVAQEKLY